MFVLHFFWIESVCTLLRRCRGKLGTAASRNVDGQVMQWYLKQPVEIYSKSDELWCPGVIDSVSANTEVLVRFITKNSPVPWSRKKKRQLPAFTDAPLVQRNLIRQGCLPFCLSFDIICAYSVSSGLLFRYHTFILNENRLGNFTRYFGHSFSQSRKSLDCRIQDQYFAVHEQEHI